MIVIGITGTLGVGKGTIVDYLVNKKGYKHYSVRDFLTKGLVKSKIKVDRTNLQDIGNQLRARFGTDYIIKKLFSQAKKRKQNAVIESIRNPKEAEFIKSQKNGYLLAIDADPKTRYLRVIRRGTETDQVTFAEYQKQERRELQSKDPNSQNLSKCISMADFKFDNNGTMKKLYEEVEKVLAKI